MTSFGSNSYRHAFFGSVGPIYRLMQKLPDDILSYLNNMASSLRGGGGGR